MRNIQQTQLKSGNALSTLAGLLTFDPFLAHSTPLGLGLKPKEVKELLDTLSKYPNPDSHLINRLECYLEQIEFAYSNPGLKPEDYTPITWGKGTKSRYLSGHTKHPFIHPKHWKEWVIDGGIDPAIALLNLQSLYHLRQVVKFLGYKANSLGWVSWGVNPFTGITDPTIATHFKPDTAYTNSKGKLVKYLYPQPEETNKVKDAIFLNTGNSIYWKEVIESNCAVTLTEGIKKGASGLSHGIPTIALAGTWMGIDKLGYHLYEVKRGLKPFLQTKRVINLAFDSDIAHKKEVYDAMVALGRSIEKESNGNVAVKVVTWEYTKQTKGMDDYIKHEGIEKFRVLLENAYTLDTFIANYEAKTTSRIVIASREDIAKFNNEDDDFVRAYLEKQIQSKYGYSTNKIHELANKLEIEQSNRVEFPETITIDDLFNPDLIEDLKFLVPNHLVVKGLSLLYGKSNHGKSWYLYNLARCLADGTKFINQMSTGKYRSLIIQMDEDSSTLRQRAQLLGINDGYYRNYIEFRVRERPWYADRQGLKWLERKIIDGGFDCVMIDGLKKIAPPSVNLFTHDLQHQIIDPLTNIGISTGCSILMVHHTNGKQEMYGYKGLNDSCSIVNYLKKVKETDTYISVCLENEKQKNVGISPNLYFDFDKANQCKIANVTTKSGTVSEGTSDTNHKESESDRLIETIKNINGATYFDKDSNSIATYSSDEFTSKTLKKFGFTASTIKRVITQLKRDNIIKEVRKEGKLSVYMLS